MTGGNSVGLGLIGCGVFSETLATAMLKSKKARLKTCFDIVPERSQRFSKTFGCDQEKSYEDLLKRDDVEGVLVVAPNVMHAELALSAARRGKHVYVEKPIANTIADGKKIIEGCAEAGVTLMVGHVRRRSAGNRKAKELLDKGVIGDPVMVEANLSTDAGFNLTPAQFRYYGDDSGCPGGALMTSGIHHVDTMNYLFGPVKSVSACFSKLYIPAQVEDVTISICRFESGVLGYLGSTYASPYNNWMYIHGTKAKLQWTVPLPLPPEGRFLHNKDEYTRLFLYEKGKEPQDIPFAFGDPILEEMDEFAHCIRTGERPETDGECGLRALAFVRAAIESARSGREVKL